MLAGHQLDDLHLSFNSSGGSLAVSSADGRIRTFDSGNGRLQVALGGPSTRSSAEAGTDRPSFDRHTCLAWVATSKAKSTENIAAGTAAGDVILYNTQEGVIIWRSARAIDGGVFSVAYSQLNGGCILAAGADGHLISLDVKTGLMLQRLSVSKSAVTCMTVSADSSHVLCGGSALALWDLKNNVRKSRYTGHPTPATTCSFSPDGAYAVSASPGERDVAVWATSSDAKKGKKPAAALVSLPMEDPAALLETCSTLPTGGEANREGAAGFHVAAVSVCGEAYVWKCSPNALGSLDTRLVARVRVGTGPTRGVGSGAEECILATKLQAGTSGPALFVARGSSTKPQFERISIPSAPSESASDEDVLISLEPSRGGLLLASGSGAAERRKAAYNKNDVTVLGPGHHGTAIAGSLVRSTVAQAEAKVDLGVPAIEEEEVSDKPVGLPQLSKHVTALENRLCGEVGKGKEPPSIPIPADVLPTVLIRALRSNDKSLQELCLTGAHPRAIKPCVKNILPMDAANLFKLAVRLLMTKPNRFCAYVSWIEAIMHQHAGYLMTAPVMQPTLAALHQACSNRATLQHQVLKLKGRLSLISAHAASRGQVPTMDGTAQEPWLSVVGGVDGAVEEPDAEDPFGLNDELDTEEDEDEDQDLDNDDGSDDALDDGDSEDDS